MYNGTLKGKISATDDENLIELLSVEKNIDFTYPPTFVWTTKEDTIVHYINSVMYVESLNKNNVLNQFDLFEHLDHAKSVGTSLVNEINNDEIDLYSTLSNWVNHSLEFLNKVFNNQ